LLVEHLGRLSYRAAWDLQLSVLEARIRGEVPDTLLLVEHEPVFTVGRNRGAADNLLDPGDIEVVEVERGGDVTFHGPGQIVAYPIVALPEGGRDLHRHLSNLEEAAIRTCADFGLEATRDDRNTGAWVGGRKICSVGIACRKWVTWHGLALNVHTDLGFFRRIHPCGLDADLLTSMQVELPQPPDMEEVAAALVKHLQAVLPFSGSPG
jgi:lipoyl(octanoyl) transferase